MASRVLLVHPDTKAAQLLIEFFKAREREPLHVWDLEQASALLELIRPELMIVDMHYQADEWLVFLRETRRKYPRLKIIITNNYPDRQREFFAQSLGIHVFIRQPFSDLWLERGLEEVNESGQRSRRHMGQGFSQPKIKIPLRVKITLPFLIVGLLFTLVGTFIVSRVLLDTIHQRYVDLLVRSGIETANWFVHKEDHLLSIERIITNVSGLPLALQKEDQDTLHGLVLPVMLGFDIDSVELVDPDGTGILSIRKVVDEDVESYNVVLGESYFETYHPLKKALQGRADYIGDKYADLIHTPWGIFLYIYGPVYGEDMETLGVVLVGMKIESILEEIESEITALVSVYDLDGSLLSSTMNRDSGKHSLTNSQVSEVLSIQENSTILRDIFSQNKSYGELLVPWEVRGGRDLGVLGISEERSYLIQLEEDTELQISLLIAFFIIMIFAVGFSLASLINKQIQPIINAANQIADGNLAVRIEADGQDELGSLAHVFNYMVVSIQEGRIFRDLMGRPITSEVRGQLRESLSTGAVQLEGQKAVATILVCDLRGFSQLCSDVDPETVFEWLNDYFGCLVPIVTVQGGVISRIDGDTILVSFGLLPEIRTPQEGALAACKTAEEIYSSIQKLNITRKTRIEPPLEFGIGISTGEVVGGGLGATDRLQYSIIGDSIRIAQGLQKLTRDIYTANGILISESTYKVLEEHLDNFHFQELGLYPVLEDGDEIGVYKLLPSSLYSPDYGGGE